MRIRNFGVLAAAVAGLAFGVPAEATTCSAGSLTCADMGAFSGHSHGCITWSTTTKRCDVSFHAEGTCNAKLGGTCTVAISGDVSDTGTCTMPVNGSCATSADASGVVFVPNGTSRSVCASAAASSVALGGSASESGGVRCFTVYA